MADIKHNATLSTDLISVWLTDDSGVTTDLKGSNTLTNSGVVETAGLQGDAGDFERADSDRLSIAFASQTGLNIAGDMSCATWINLESLPTVAGSNYQILTFKSADGNEVAYTFYIEDSANKLGFFYQGAGGTTLSVTNAAVFSGTGSYVHVGVSVDVSAASVIFYVNGSAVADTNSLSDATNMLTLSDGTFYIGADQVNTRYYIDGIVNQVVIWNKIASAAEFSDLYNSGIGIPYDDGSGSTNSNFFALM